MGKVDVITDKWSVRMYVNKKGAKFFLFTE